MTPDPYLDLAHALMEDAHRRADLARRIRGARRRRRRQRRTPGRAASSGGTYDAATSAAPTTARTTPLSEVTPR
jgi:hypothetical protein